MMNERVEGVECFSIPRCGMVLERAYCIDAAV